VNRPKLAIVVSHPIQHFCPQYSSWARLGLADVKVFFASRHGLDAYYDKDFDKEIQWQGLKLDFDHTFLPHAPDKKVSAKIDCPEVDFALADFNPDLVLVYGYIQPLQRRVMRWVKANDKRLLMIGDSELRQARSKLKGIVKRFWLPYVFSAVDIFLTVGDANEAYYRSYGVPDYKMVRTFFPIDVALFDRALQLREQQRAAVRQLLDIPDDHLVVLMVGKLVSWKRQRDLVAASNELQSRKAKVSIVLAGTGPDGKQLETLAQLKGPGGVIFAGFVPPEELVHYFSAADTYVHCSAQEPHSLAISEAIYAGLPILVSDRCGSYGPSDDVRTGLNGYVYPCGDVPVLVTMLERLFASPKLRQELGRESQQMGIAHQALAHGKAISQALVSLDTMDE
jgi:glycosyltransferase involved in cell wall biosynthesis